jgi:hypothetical protein
MPEPLFIWNVVGEHDAEAFLDFSARFFDNSVCPEGKGE